MELDEGFFCYLRSFTHILTYYKLFIVYFYNCLMNDCCCFFKIIFIGGILFYFFPTAIFFKRTMLYIKIFVKSLQRDTCDSIADLFDNGSLSIQYLNGRCLHFNFFIVRYFILIDFSISDLSSLTERSHNSDH